MCKRDDVCVWWVGGMLAVAKIVKLEQEKKRLLQINFRVKVRRA